MMVARAPFYLASLPTARTRRHRPGTTAVMADVNCLFCRGTPLLVVDQPASIGALPIVVARAEGIAVAHLPGLAMRRNADVHAGEAKTDARDAAIIAEAVRSMSPHCALCGWRTTRSPN